jgi:hypothetical protein
MTEAHDDDDLLELVPLATVSVAPGAAYRIEDGPFGNRIVAGIAEGRCRARAGRCCSTSAR